MTRMLCGPGHRRSIPLTFLIGAHFMILADIVSRTLIVHRVLPIGVVTALVGAPSLWRCFIKTERSIHEYYCGRVNRNPTSADGA